ncbi:hypothetical protein BV25DRAFT_1850432 [Artomyces pyxidatus]|uniref:Uncharacterized protein n=1 Tax=Artomyces pyxidatus TaxID=48021 RepID=A0ACB8TAF8_9AGAM|nr:hypothetical protein BV25DRAFT_1850432 [Artomyces pyxidatus]
MPVTRSSNAVASSSRLAVDGSGEDSASERDQSSTDLSIEAHLSLAQKGVANMRDQIRSLQRKNARLKEELDKLHNADDVSIQPKRGRSATGAVQAQIKGLEADVRRLEKARVKDKRKIEQLKMKEIRADARDLEDDQTHGVPDTVHGMRKLLRRFQAIVSGSVIAEDEECPICMDTLQLSASSSLPCQHVFCEDCLARLEQLVCPTCREKFERDDVEGVQYTAEEQWDQLLDVAQQFAKMDKNAEPDTSEEEAEEAAAKNFINDEDPDASSALSELEAETQSEAPPATPGPADDDEEARQSYAKSPISAKRKRLQELAAKREQKRRLR